MERNYDIGPKTLDSTNSKSVITEDVNKEIPMEDKQNGVSISNINGDVVVSTNQSGGQTAKTIINQRPVGRSLKHTREAIIKELKKYEPIDYDIHVLMNDMEAYSLATEIRDILVVAGWPSRKIIRGMGGVYPPGFTVTTNKPSKLSEIMTLVLFNSGLRGGLLEELRGTKLCIYVGPNPDSYTGQSKPDLYFEPRSFD